MLNTCGEGVGLRFAGAIFLFRQLQTGVPESAFGNIVLGRQANASALGVASNAGFRLRALDLALTAARADPCMTTESRVGADQTIGIGKRWCDEVVRADVGVGSTGRDVITTFQHEVGLQTTAQIFRTFQAETAAVKPTAIDHSLAK